MTSLISWLDASTDENQRMRELVKLFGSPETTDDLGTGQLRDAISNSLFPGTSVLHVGARYMILVPWAYLTSRHGVAQPDHLRLRVEESERRLVDRFKEIGVQSFIGRDAGRTVQQLPSAAYWSALRRFGIVNPEVDRATAAQLMCSDPPVAEEGQDAFSVWHPSLPKPPEGFPATEDRGLELTNPEAEWLQERILSTCSGTMLAHLVTAGNRPATAFWAPWLDPACRSAEDEPSTWLRDAEAFSFVHNGASILYQRLLAEHVPGHIPSRADFLEKMEALLDNWEGERPFKQELLAAWDLEDFLSRARTLNRGISSSTLEFARAITESAQNPSKLIDNTEVRTAVERRERLMKKANSRFKNERRLRAWTPPGSVSALTFRWQQVRRTVLDVHDGLEKAPEVSHA
ncbi:DUF6361 family protein [Arthrobacter mangrovi]|uniref:Uncharacterized protein n=1 Tax=Arthrobacter mangrovi TaxID=2966350 RepID=A0ABQ5MY98_9MICC|nr:DUF6361 family protein [Arthrobacter mangrovi]GLB68967.1 hypothetical protein AHIS1636_34100 [Arthrobacter mangrovi]